MDPDQGAGTRRDEQRGAGQRLADFEEVVGPADRRGVGMELCGEVVDGVAGVDQDGLGGSLHQPGRERRPLQCRPAGNRVADAQHRRGAAHREMADRMRHQQWDCQRGDHHAGMLQDSVAYRQSVTPVEGCPVPSLPHRLGEAPS